MLGQLLDRIAAVLEDALLAVDVGDGATAGGGVDESWVVRGQPRLAVDRDLFEISGADGPVSDRDLVLQAGTVVANVRESLGGSTVGVSVMRTTYARPEGLNSRGPYDLGHWRGQF